MVMEEQTAPVSLLERRLKTAGVPAFAAEKRTFESFIPSSGSMSALAACKKFVTDAREHPFLTLAGECGRGKSHLAIAALQSFLAGLPPDTSNLSPTGIVTGAPRVAPHAVYFQVEHLLDELRRTFDKNCAPGEFDRLMTRLCECELLILDDLGVENGSDWTKAKLDEIVEDRYFNERMTIVTTNVTASQLSPRVASRLQEGVTIVIDGLDYRHVKATERNKTKRCA